MRVEAVDPRDTRWQEDQPVYRVYLWSKAPLPPGVDARSAGWASHESDISEADVGEVLEWAKQNLAPGGRFSIFVRSMRDGEPGLLRLAGWEPTRTTSPPAWVD